MTRREPLSRPDPFFSLFWLGRGVTRGVFLSRLYSSMLAWYGSQSEAAVYRCLWLGIIFRQPFPHCVLWDLVFVLLPLSTSFTSRFVVSLFCLVQSSTSINMWNPDHAALWSEYASNDERDSRRWPLHHLRSTVIYREHLWGGCGSGRLPNST